MKLGYIGLGKMGQKMVERLLERQHEIVVFDKDEQVMQQIAWKGAQKAQSQWNLVELLHERPRVIWLMVPHQAVDSVLEDIIPLLHDNDVVIDGGNSFYKDSQRRAADLAKRSIHFLDAGISGGPQGAVEGACVMVGGNRGIYKAHESLFHDIATDDGYGYMGEAGAGHFVKMVHNGIEYGMMQAIAEGFEIMKKSPYDLDIKKIADLYNHRSVVESRLVGWLKDAYAAYGEDLAEISGSVAQSGEGEWTVKTAKELGVPVPGIESAVEFRKQSQNKPSYTGKVLSAMRNQFGGHSVK